MSNLKNAKAKDCLNGSCRQSVKIKSISVSRNDKSVLNLTTECGLFFKVHDEVAYEFKLSPGKTVDTGSFMEMLESNEARMARHSAMSMALRSSVSERMLLQKLAMKGFSKDAAVEAVSYVSRNGYVNDADYAGDFVMSRKSRTGRLRLKQELAMKGISREAIDEALDEYSDDEELEGALSEAQKKLPSLDGLEYKKKRERLTSFLLRRGYSYEIAREALKKLDLVL